MDLRARLARLDALQRPAAARAAVDGTSREPALRAAGLRPVATDAGTVWARESHHAMPAPDLQHLAPPVILRSLPDGTTAAHLLLLDTETSGLAGGTGTIVFLVGLAWWEDDRLVVRQLMLPGPGREEPLLAELQRIAARFRVVVTYNGNRFDLPLLRTRGILARRRDLLEGLASWDLLPAARRLWGRRLPDCRQGSVERAVGRFRPGEDLPGSLVPAVWQAFVREGRGDRLPDVLRHNEQDMVGMAAIAGAVAAAARRLAASGPDASPLPWQDCWSLARLAERIREDRRASAWIERAVATAGRSLAEVRSVPPEELVRDAVRILKRTSPPADVANLLERAHRWYGSRPWLEREAAVVWEHRLGDPARALAHARRLGDPHRLARLERKLANAARRRHRTIAPDTMTAGGDSHERTDT